MNGAGFIDVLVMLGVIGLIVASAFAGAIGFWRRSLSVVAVALGATLVVSSLLRIVPGDPIESILGDRAPQEARDQLARDLHLVDDDGQAIGFVAQYTAFLGGAIAAGTLALAPTAAQDKLSTWLPDEPMSYRTRKPARLLIAARFGSTVRLALAAVAVAVLLGITLGTLAAWRRGQWLDGVAMTFALLGVAVPRFWLGPLLILTFGVTLRWLPVSGNDDGLASLVLPAVSLGTALAAVLARLTRASLLEVLEEDYIRTARAKGLSERVVMLKHALRNALIPVLTVVGLQLGAVLAGAVVTEKVFAWPGIGLLLLESIRRLDVPVVQLIVLLIAIIYVSVNVVVDVFYALIDPRVRIAGASS